MILASAGFGVEQRRRRALTRSVDRALEQLAVAFLGKPARPTRAPPLARGVRIDEVRRNTRRHGNCRRSRITSVAGIDVAFSPPASARIELAMCGADDSPPHQRTVPQKVR